jgi:excisionase family DNA binding protein
MSTHTRFQLPSNIEPLLTYADVAHLLGVTPRTIQRYVKEGWLRPRRFSRRTVRFRRADVERFFDQVKNSPGQNIETHHHMAGQLSLPLSKS